LNPESHVRHALAFAACYGFHPAYAIYEPGFTRAGAALARAIGTKTPIYRLMFSETFAYGFPLKQYALSAHLALLDDEDLDLIDPQAALALDGPVQPRRSAFQVQVNAASSGCAGNRRNRLTQCTQPPAFDNQRASQSGAGAENRLADFSPRRQAVNVPWKRGRQCRASRFDSQSHPQQERRAVLADS